MHLGVQQSSSILLLIVLFVIVVIMDFKCTFGKFKLTCSSQIKYNRLLISLVGIHTVYLNLVIFLAKLNCFIFRLSFLIYIQKYK